MRTAKYVRLDAGLTGTAVALAIGATQPGYSAWENGKGTLAEHRREALLDIMRDLGYARLRLEDLESPVERVAKRRLRRG